MGLNQYLAIAGALAIVIMGALLKNSYERNGELEAKLKTQAEQTQEAADANVTNIETITKLKLQIGDMVEQRRVDAEKREQLLMEREADLMRARAEADRLRKLRENEQDENPDCKELARLRVDLFCPATADQLRQRSRGEGGHENRDSGGPG
jgi:hypothetical protein